MQRDQTSNPSVIEGKSAKGWTVATAANGKEQTFAVFRSEDDAHAYADFERGRLGLKRVYIEARL
jgi:hypothetical protein